MDSLSPAALAACLVTAVGAFVGAALFTARLVTWTRGLGIIDPPNSGFHRASTPRGGGVAIVVVVLATALAAWAWLPDGCGRLVGCLIPAAVVAAVSWLDDVRSLPALVRLAVHVGSAAAAVLALGPAPGITLGTWGTLSFGLAAWPLTMLWIVGLTNAFNFMDGIDGIAGLTACVAGTALAVASAAADSLPIALVATAFAAAALGFLTCNWEPARIFLGDVGSTWCGFLVAVMPLALPAEQVAGGLAVAAAAAWPFIFDTSITLVGRILKRENVLVPHRGHLYQRLVIAGWSHRAVAGLYAGLAASAAVAVLVAGHFPGALSGALCALAMTIGGGSVALATLVSAAGRSAAIEETRHAGSRG